MKGLIMGITPLEAQGGKEHFSILCGDQIYYAPIDEFGRYNANKMLGTEVFYNFKEVKEVIKEDGTKESIYLASIAEAQEGMKADILGKLTINSTLKDTQVIEINDKGVIVDYRGARFFLPRNDLTRCGVHPRKILKKGDFIDVTLIKLDIFNEEGEPLTKEEILNKPTVGIVSRIKKEGLKEEKWNEDNFPYVEKGKYVGTVARIVPRGVIVELDGDIPAACVHPGIDIKEDDRVLVRVLKTIPKNMRVKGSIIRHID